VSCLYEASPTSDKIKQLIQTTKSWLKTDALSPETQQVAVSYDNGLQAGLISQTTTF
jgi:DNA gyrase inhibitor GyrI